LDISQVPSIDQFDEDRMSDSPERQQTAIPWPVFVLASSAPLGHYRQVHLAPTFPPERLNLALRSSLPLHENELLVALIDSDASGFQSAIVLTTSRIYWSERVDGEKDRWRFSNRPSAIRTFGMDYALIPETVRVASTDPGRADIALGATRTLTLLGPEAHLADAVASYLRTVGMAARRGVSSAQSGLDLNLLERARAALPRVAAVSERIRALNRDLLTFRRDLTAATPRVVLTPLLTAICVLLFVLMVIGGVHPVSPTVQQLLSWGANQGARVALRHEWWRLPASVFLHGGLIHLAVNMWCLLSIGPLVERLFGNLAFGAVFVAAGIGGAIASTATLPVRVSVGASGAIFGMLGALLAFLLTHRSSVPGSVLRPLRSSALSFVVFNTLFGAAVPNIDQSAHVGGLFSGCLAGFFLSRPWPVVRSRWVTLRRMLSGVLLATCLAGAASAVVQWRERTLAPYFRYEDFTDQIAPLVQEFNAVSQEMPTVETLQDEAENMQEAGHLAALKELLARATANSVRLKRVRTPDRDLQDLERTLEVAISAQVTTIQASLDYLAIRNPGTMSAAARVKREWSAIGRATREFENRQRAYLDKNGLVGR
jgi:rhomboid protease GluP